MVPNFPTGTLKPLPIGGAPPVQRLRWAAAVASTVGLLLVSLLIIGWPPVGGHRSSYGPRSHTCFGSRVTPHDDVASVVASQPAGVTFCLSPGRYRVAEPIRPRDGDTIWGQPGTQLDGSLPVTDWHRDTYGWRSDVRLNTSAHRVGVCADAVRNPCQRAEQVFRDERPLVRVTALPDLRRGTFFVDYDAKAVYVADNPAGSRIDLASAETAIGSASRDVTVRDLEVEKFATPAQQGAIMVAGAGWTISACNVHGNHGAGVYVGGDHARVVGNTLHDNGQLGGASHRARDLTVLENYLSRNNTDGFLVNDWEAGGWKATGTEGIFGRNQVRDNASVGLWFDLHSDGIRASGNTVIGNAADGIRFEISSHGQILWNVVRRNGWRSGAGGGPGLFYGAGITINTSTDVLVCCNSVDDNVNGVSLQARDRQGSLARGCQLARVAVRGNRVSLGGGDNGLVQDVGDPSCFTTSGNVFENNRYRMDHADRAAFAWFGRYLTLREWHDRYGQG